MITKRMQELAGIINEAKFIDEREIKNVLGNLKYGKIVKITNKPDNTVITYKDDDGYQIVYDISKDERGKYQVYFTDSSMYGSWDTIRSGVSNLRDILKVIKQHSQGDL